MRKPKKRQDDTPEKLRPFIGLQFDPAGYSGAEAYGDCVFCGKSNKMYVNTHTGQWSCKSGHCAKEGNVHTFLELWWKERSEHSLSSKMKSRWSDLSQERGIPTTALHDAGLVWDPDAEVWWLPVRNHKGTMVNLRHYRMGQKLRGLPGMDSALYGAEELQDKKKSKWKIYLCEGEWDAICLRLLLEAAGEDAIVLAVPGCSVFKDAWIELFAGREVIICYDNDEDGRRGASRVYNKLHGTAKKIFMVRWAEEFNDKFDIRDFAKYEGTMEVLHEMIEPFKDLSIGAEDNDDPEDPRPWLRDAKDRPTFEEVLARFRKRMFMTPDMEDALWCIFAVVMSNQMDGDPLWMHIAGPPGCGKTEIISTLSDCFEVIMRSTITLHGLISGFQMPGGRDPSLIPMLIDKVFVLKDFTEILEMPQAMRKEVYSIFRGAYDGKAAKSFGNGVERSYEGHFSMISGVTQAVFAEHGASLGERFLIFHLVKGVGFQADEMIRAAIANVGGETAMKTDLRDITTKFLNVKLDRKTDLPSVPDKFIDRIVALAQFVAMLRASSEKDPGDRTTLLYRPQHEAGTRIAKQLTKLMMSLALVKGLDVVDRECYNVAVRVAMDSCVGFNLDVVQALAKDDGKTVYEISEMCNIPHTTLRERLTDMVMLGVLDPEKTEVQPGKMGAPPTIYWLTERIRGHWEQAKLETAPISVKPRLRKRPRAYLRKSIKKGKS